MVEKPPKLIIKLAQIIAVLKGSMLEMSRQPLVNSTSPPKKADIGEGKSDKRGEREEITTKNIAIIAPTEITL